MSVLGGYTGWLWLLVELNGDVLAQSAGQVWSFGGLKVLVGLCVCVCVRARVLKLLVGAICREPLGLTSSVAACAMQANQAGDEAAAASHISGC